MLTVDVTADTGVSAHSLSVLAPKTIGSLGVDKAVWVDDGCDVKVEFIDERLDSRITGILG